MTAAQAAQVSVLSGAGIAASELAPGWSVQADEIVWKDGDVRVSLVAQSYADCDSGYVCFYADKNYGGRMLQFRDAGLRGDMRTYTFNDQMSSYRSRRALDARWYYNYDGNGTSRCIAAVSSNPDVGSGILNTDNDEMSSFRIYGDDTHC